MNIVAELHTHTCLSHHAHHTLGEMFAEASVLGLKAMALTNHGPALDDGVNKMHFGTIWQLPRFINGVYFIKGAEANLVDYEGHIDLPEKTLKRLEFVIASMHDSVISPGTKEENTNTYLEVLKNPGVHCLGHCGNPKYPIDYETVVKAVKDQNKLIEINSHSFLVRKGSDMSCREVALLCMKLGVRVAVTTDAHSIYDLLRNSAATSMLEEIGFPEELIINTSMPRLEAYFKEIAGIDIPID
jgi:putative hydrolase